MADATPARKSTRGRVPNKKYSNDALEILNDILNSGSDVEVDHPPKLDTSDDEDFRSDAIAEESEAEEDTATESEAGSDGSGIATPEEEFEDALSYADPDDVLDVSRDLKSLEGLFRYTGLAGSKRINRRRNPDSHLHSRGIPSSDKDGSKASHIRSLIGTEPKDLQNFSLAREKWTQDATLPTRKPDKHDRGGMGLPFGHEKQSEEFMARWDWYHQNNGKEAMSRLQRTRALDGLQAPDYLPGSRPNHSFLMGPYGNQTVRSLKVEEVASLEELWCPSAPETEEGSVPRNRMVKKKGWMLNVGSKIRCLGWALGHAGKAQYLAIAPTYNPPAKFRAPTAFDPSEPYPASIQLWAFSSFGEPYPAESMNLEEYPQLVQLVCTGWGAPRQFRWCPVSQAFPDQGVEGRVFVGLLAGVWSDGYVRVLDIQLDTKTSSSNVHGIIPLPMTLTALIILPSPLPASRLRIHPTYYNLHLLDLALSNRTCSRLRERLRRHMGHLRSDPLILPGIHLYLTQLSAPTPLLPLPPPILHPLSLLHLPQFPTLPRLNLNRRLPPPHRHPRPHN